MRPCLLFLLAASSLPAAIITTTTTGNPNQCGGYTAPFGNGWTVRERGNNFEGGNSSCSTDVFMLLQFNTPDTVGNLYFDIDGGGDGSGSDFNTFYKAGSFYQRQCGRTCAGPLPQFFPGVTFGTTTLLDLHVGAFVRILGNGTLSTHSDAETLGWLYNIRFVPTVPGPNGSVIETQAVSFIDTAEMPEPAMFGMAAVTLGLLAWRKAKRRP